MNWISIEDQRPLFNTTILLKSSHGGLSMCHVKEKEGSLEYQICFSERPSHEGSSRRVVYKGSIEYWQYVENV